MAGHGKSGGNAPFAMALEVEFLDRLSEPVRLGKAESVSGIIRAALARFDFSNVLVVRPAQLQVSVRLPARIRQLLKKTARSKHTSVGQLVRAAVEAYLPQLESEAAGQLEMPIAVPPPPPPEPARKKSRSRKRRSAAAKKQRAMTGKPAPRRGKRR